MNRLRWALLLFLIDATVSCKHLRPHPMPEDAATDAESTPDDSGEVDARPAEAGDAADAATDAEGTPDDDSGEVDARPAEAGDATDAADPG